MDKQERLATILSADRTMDLDEFIATYFSNYNNFRVMYSESVFIHDIEVFVPLGARLKLFHDFDGAMMTSFVTVTEPFGGETILHLEVKSKPITFTEKEITVIYP